MKINLNDIFNNDELGLLVDTPKAQKLTSEDRLTSSFLEINDFVRDNGRIPQKRTSPSEHILASRLEHIQVNLGDDDLEELKKYDEFNLLSKQKGIGVLDEVFNEDEFDLLADEVDLFEIKNIPNLQRQAADYVARRKHCKNFDKYEDKFEELHNDIKNKAVTLVHFSESSQIKKGTYFILGGIIGWVIEMDALKKDAYRSFDGRLYCVFENGTESNMLFRSLIKLLQADETSRVIYGDQNTLFDEEDQEAGYIYILSSESEDEEVKKIENLYKVGFSGGDVEKRIKNAENDPTYLMAPVKVVSSFKCYNMNPQRLERLLHRFFSEAQLSIDIADANGNRYTPKEWFVAPLNVIERAVYLIINGEIINHKYDNISKKIIEVKK